MSNHQSQTKFQTMANDLIGYLTRIGYSTVTINSYNRCIKQINILMEKLEVEQFNSEICQIIVKNLIGDKVYADLPKHNKAEIRCINAVLEYHLTGSISFRSVRKDTTLKGLIGSTISDYLSYRKERSIAQDTLDENQLYLQRFQNYLESHDITAIKEVTQTDILSYIKSLSFYSMSTIHCTLCTLRGFLRYLHYSGIMDVDWSYLVPKDNYKKEAKLPTTYEKDEVEGILNAVDRGNPKGKRDYAMLLLATRLGLRASDICRMKFENLLWKQNLIILTQQKTSKRIELPLLSEIGDAIIDYLKYARPKSDLPYVFLHVNPNYERIQEPTLHSIVTHYMKLANIPNISQKKHGPHALRHSLAGFLLEKKIPLPIISEVLGHSNAESTKTYLRIDIHSLRQCAIDVPALNKPFYESGRCKNG